VPRAEAGAGRTQVRRYPIHGYQRDLPSTLLAPTLPLRGGEFERTVTTDSAPLDSGSHINAKRTASCPNVAFHVHSKPQRGSAAVPGRAGGCPTGPPTDPYVSDSLIRFLSHQSLGPSLAHTCCDPAGGLRCGGRSWGWGAESVPATAPAWSPCSCRSDCGDSTTTAPIYRKRGT
jgi:hypothetical protein